MGEESRLGNPAGIEDLVLRRMSIIVGLGGSLVTRLCEGRFGITRREWVVLALLAPQQKLAWSDLASRSEVDGAQLSRAVSSLVAKGLATKTQLRNRRLEVCATDKGASLYAELYPLARDINLALLSVLDSGALSSLDRMLDDLLTQGKKLSRETEVPKAGRLHGRRQPT